MDEKKFMRSMERQDKMEQEEFSVREEEEKTKKRTKAQVAKKKL